MHETILTSDEKRCLQFWFKEAISALEREKVHNELVNRRRLSLQQKQGRHFGVERKRPRRSIHGSRIKEFV